MTQTNETRLKSFYEAVFTGGDIDATDNYIDEDLVDHAPWPGQQATRAGFKDGLREIRNGFPDLSVLVERVIVEGDLVAAHNKISGTHLGDFMGAAGSGKTFSIDAIDIVRMADGRIVEHWGVLDSDAMAEQIGLEA